MPRMKTFQGRLSPSRVSGSGGTADLLAARLAVMFFFLLDGTLLGSWFVRIPEVQRDLGLSNGTLGLALFGTAAGALVTQPLTGWLVARWGRRRITTIGALAQCAALTLPPIASGLLPLIIALVVLGGATGVIDVAMNVQGAAVERPYGRSDNVSRLLQPGWSRWGVGSRRGSQSGNCAGASPDRRSHAVCDWRGMCTTPLASCEH